VNLCLVRRVGFGQPVSFMAIRDTEPVVGATRRRESSRVGEAVAVAPVTGARSTSSSLAGVADAELSPKLRQAIHGPLGAVQQLERALDEARASGWRTGIRSCPSPIAAPLCASRCA
jgi:hypothetical protein